MTKKVSARKGIDASAPTPVGDGVVLEWVQHDMCEPNPWQPRQHFDEAELADLEASIAENGVQQPMLARIKPGVGNENIREIADGGRRLKCVTKLAIAFPILVRPYTDQQMAEIALLANDQRADVSPVERAMGYKRLVDEFGLKQDDIAERAGRSPGSISNSLRLLELPKDVLDLISKGILSEAHGKALLRYKDFPAFISWYAGKIVRDRLPSKEIEKHIRVGGHADLQEAKKLKVGIACDWNTAFDKKAALKKYPTKFFSSAYDYQPWCLDVALYNKLQKEAVDEREARQKASNSGNDDSALTPEEQARVEEQRRRNEESQHKYELEKNRKQEWRGRAAEKLLLMEGSDFLAKEICVTQLSQSTLSWEDGEDMEEIANLLNLPLNGEAWDNAQEGDRIRMILEFGPLDILRFNALYNLLPEAGRDVAGGMFLPIEESANEELAPLHPLDWVEFDGGEGIAVAQVMDVRGTDRYVIKFASPGANDGYSCLEIGRSALTKTAAPGWLNNFGGSGKGLTCEDCSNPAATIQELCAECDPDVVLLRPVPIEALQYMLLDDGTAEGIRCQVMEQMLDQEDNPVDRYRVQFDQNGELHEVLVGARKLSPLPAEDPAPAAQGKYKCRNCGCPVAHKQIFCEDCDPDIRRSEQLKEKELVS